MLLYSNVIQFLMKSKKAKHSDGVTYA